MQCTHLQVDTVHYEVHQTLDSNPWLLYTNRSLQGRRHSGQLGQDRIHCHELTPSWAESIGCLLYLSRYRSHLQQLPRRHQ